MMFQPSQLGTKDYWDSAYEKELTNFSEFGDVGEIWFGEDTQERVISYIFDNDLLLLHNHDANQSDTISVVDLGCGNGTFSLRLAQEIEQDVAENSDSPVGKKTVNIVGIDYAAPSIKLAYHVLNKELKTIIDTKPEFQNNTEEELDIVVNNEELIQEAHVDTIGMGYAVTDHQPDYSILDHSIAKLQFVTYDFVQNSILGMTKLLATKFDIVHDKGTFDAVALSVDQQKLELYKAHAMEIINKDGFFIITSCNFTADELKQQFQDYFTVFHELEYPTFEFGGSKGSTFCTIIFKLK